MINTIEPFVGTDDVAELIGKPTSWVHNNAGRLGIPRYRLGKQYRYLLSEVREWMRGLSA